MALYEFVNAYIIKASCASQTDL